MKFPTEVQIRHNGFTKSRLALIVFILIGSLFTCFGQTTPMVKIQRGPCYGSCPEYVITIWQSGRVQFNGLKFTQVPGKLETKLNKRQVGLIRSEIEKSKFFSLQDTYDERTCPNFWTDDSTVTITVNSGGLAKTISHYQGCTGEDTQGIDFDKIYPPALFKLEKRIEEIVGSKKWIEKKVNTTERSTNLENPIIERAAR